MNKLNLLIDKINSTQINFELRDYTSEAKKQLIKYYKVRSLHVEKLTVERIEEISFIKPLTTKAKEIKSLTNFNI